MLSHVAVAARDVASKRPDIVATTFPVTLAAGVDQVVPDGVDVFLGAVSNESGQAINNADGALMDVALSDWRNDTPTSVVTDCIYRAVAPRQFEVYPPSAGGTSITIRGVPVIAPADETADIPVPRSAEKPLLYLVLSLAYQENTGTAANRELAIEYERAAMAMLGTEGGVRAAIPPKAKGVDE